jgi:hypothetical protein
LAARFREQSGHPTPNAAAETAQAASLGDETGDHPQAGDRHDPLAAFDISRSIAFRPRPSAARLSATRTIDYAAAFTLQLARSVDVEPA